MLAALTVHIAAVMLWCASLLYLPVFIAVSESKDIPVSPPGERGSMARFIFTNIASPAAIIAIIAGTTVFLLDHTVEFWLIAKLTLICGLAGLHALTGLFLLEINKNPDRPVLRKCILLAGMLAILMISIISTVLAKPGIGAFP